ncbi:nitrite reductase small subunit NirD [Hydrogenophaga sp.]|uniref:nitrite reductase small subunit NirD n=1 Tax=Hydrogenophaga sp. TaxID=1904254 RepID=UPI00286D7BEA|nr:nitrite reductase small subunit NirD [Hydrogenophaga sp.]
MSQWTPICQVDDIPVLGSRRVARAQGLDVAVFRNDQDEVFALLDRCPHKGGPLSQGIVFGTHVACPLHNWTIGLCDGQASAPDEGCTPKFSVKVENGQVFLDATQLASHATDLERPIAGPKNRRPHAPPLRGSLPPEGADPAWGGPAPDRNTSKA